VIAVRAGVNPFDEPITKRLLAAAVPVLGSTALAVRHSLALRPARWYPAPGCAVTTDDAEREAPRGRARAQLDPQALGV
jgi:hypothetical protein